MYYSRNSLQRKVNRRSRAMHQAKLELSQEEYAKVNDSYGRGVVSGFVFIFLFMLILFFGMALLGYVTRIQGKLGVLEYDGTVRYISNGRFIKSDVSDLAGLDMYGKQVLITVEDDQVTKIEGYREYMDKRKNILLTGFALYLLVLAASGIIYWKLYKNIFAKDWYTYLKHYDKMVSEGGYRNVSQYAKVNITSPLEPVEILTPKVNFDLSMPVVAEPVKPTSAVSEEIPAEPTAKPSTGLTEPREVIAAMGKLKAISEEDKYLAFVFENDYIIKAKIDYKHSGGFWVLKSSMNNWEPPHEKDVVGYDVIYAVREAVEHFSSDDNLSYLFI